ncbi:CBS domain-containing protein [Sporolactobacillus laevolacticus]|jgi:CBS domain-containing protein|uniref:Inosine-5-monophosphate dehydrogenase n=1 Tax=Sporolactobacillus laevolacticus DSM 442 TaxID=1395513 RepID=V6J281_9BACL|nr:CBS domain-containing protein [Sporolactobacillus laevolacticus]EST13256.1 inosine-5-monophosphate dehydrogenase [Sporolactobacillus laevolacticus DSM 442]MDN3956321.1 CBS domain-containing protein [Sporolactobacillus laevolacticus]
MNAAFLITPKSDVKFVYDHWTIRQALEKMEHYRYSAIPILNKKGIYVGTLTEGDILWNLKKNEDLDFWDTEKMLLKDVPRYRDIKAISIDVEIEDIMEKSLSQNFVPIVDDSGVFIGIIRRREIISYLLKLREEAQSKA